MGCKNNSQDVYEHRWFRDYDWDGLMNMTLPAFHTPRIKYINLYDINYRSIDDTSNYADYYDSDTEVISLEKDHDPFLNWGV